MAGQIERYLAQLQRQKQPASRLYALIDAAEDDKVSELLSVVAPSRYRSLLQGKWSQALAAVAPYLVQLDVEDPSIRELIEIACHENGVVFLASAADPEALLRHCRSRLQVQTREGERLFFRFYDPRVLSVFVAYCRARNYREERQPEQNWLYGPIQTFWIQRSEPEARSLQRLAGLNLDHKSIARPLILSPQLQRLYDKTAEQRFQEGVKEEIRQDYADLIVDFSNDDLTKMVTYGVGLAKKHGFTWESSIYQFVDLMFDISPDFPRYPPFKEALKSTQVSSEYRITQLISLLTREQWEQARTDHAGESRERRRWRLQQRSNKTRSTRSTTAGR